jgi:hypothetical protein
LIFDRVKRQRRLAESRFRHLESTHSSSPPHVIVQADPGSGTVTVGI